MKATLALAALVLCLGGCFSLAPEEVVDLVDYEVVVPPPAAADRSLPLTLAVRPFSASDDLEREGIRYRTSDVEGGFWADHRWAEPVPSMVRDATIDYLEATGLLSRVYLMDNMAFADVLLVAEIHRFDEVDGAEGWSAVAEITFEAQSEGQVVYHRRFRAEEACTDRTVREVVRALGRALGKILAGLAADVRAGKVGGGS